MLNLFKVIIIGIIEGITEWLPISSTGHMILAEEFIRLKMSEEFMEMFNVVIQLGAILAVCVLYFHRLNPFSPKKSPAAKKGTLILWGKVLIGCLPAAVIGILFNDTIDKLFYNPQTVAFTLILYGILFIVVEKRNEGKDFKVEKMSQLSYLNAFEIGLFQLLALIPGTSRSGSTILGGMVLGVSRKVSAEYSFFLSIPVMFGASLLKLVKFGFHFTPLEAFTLLVGMLVAFVVSILAIRFLMGYIKQHDFKAFGVYRIVLGLLVVVYFFFIKA